MMQKGDLGHEEWQISYIKNLNIFLKACSTSYSACKNLQKEHTNQHFLQEP